MKTAICAGVLIGFLALAAAAQSWIDISSSLVASQGLKIPWPSGCSGVVANRLTGDVIIDIVGNGLWKSSDQGKTYVRIDNNTVSGEAQSGWAFDVDQDDPKRMAIFSIDGSAAYTLDGTTWKKMADIGRNWDYGSVDWGTADAKVMVVTSHESGGTVYKTTDGAATWSKVPISVGGMGSSISMIGVIDAATFIYCNGSGIFRSVDVGATWAKVSAVNSQSRTPMKFKGVCYLGTANGLLVSKDKGATWQSQGAPVNIWQGPFFGTDEKTMVVAGTQGIYKSVNTGTSWTKVCDFPKTSNFFDAYWFADIAWEPVNNTLYATRMVEAAYKYVLPATTVRYKAASRSLSGDVPSSRIIKISDGLVMQGLLKQGKAAEVYDVKGKLMYRSTIATGGRSIDVKICAHQIAFVKVLK